MISAHEQGKNFGCLKVGSPDGNNVAEFKGLLEVAVGAPTRGKLWVNGKRVLGQEYGDLCEGFGPSCAWSPDSRFLALIMWVEGLHTVYAIYDTQSEELLVVKHRKNDSNPYTIETAQKVFETARKNGFEKPKPPKKDKEKVEAEIENYEAMIRRWADVPPYELAVEKEISHDRKSKSKSEIEESLAPSNALEDLEKIKTNLLAQAETRKKPPLKNLRTTILNFFEFLE